MLFVFASFSSELYSSEFGEELKSGRNSFEIYCIKFSWSSVFNVSVLYFFLYHFYLILLPPNPIITLNFLCFQCGIRLHDYYIFWFFFASTFPIMFVPPSVLNLGKEAVKKCQFLSQCLFK